MTFLEAKQALARKLDIDYSDIANNDLFSAVDLADWIQQGHLRVWDYKPWPFTQKTKTVTTVDTDYYDQPSGLMLGSIFKLIVGGKEFEDPIRFEDYLLYKEQYPTGTAKKWALHETYIFVNKYAYSIGDAMDIIGKEIAPALSADGDLLPFSPQADNSEHSGNQAIVLLAYAEALASEKLQKQAESELQEKKAYRILDSLWNAVAQQQSGQQSVRQMFTVPDYFAGRSNRNHPIGGFNL